MKKTLLTGKFRNTLVAMALLLGTFMTGQAQVVVIDPGHGYDCSGVNRDGRTTTEIETSLAAGLKLRDLINNNNCGWTVQMTRTTNGNCGWTSVTQRATQSNNWNATRFISIHCNAGGGTGTETFYCNQSSSSTALDQAFGQKVQNNMVTEGQWTNRRMVEDRSYLPFHLGVLRTNNAPGCLSEIGFVDKASDAVKLNSNFWRDKFALAYYKALQQELGTCPGPGGGGNGNLAPDGTIWSYTTQLSSSYAASKAIDQSVGTRWNSNGAAATNYFVVRLDNSYNINEFKVKHASNAGLSVNLNTERYYVLYWNGSGWANAVTNYNNSSKAAITSHNVNITAEWVCLYITDPTFTADLYSRIPEFEVYGTASNKTGGNQPSPPHPAFGDVALDGASILATPNVMASGEAQFEVKVPEITEATIEIIDMTGKVVKEVPSRIFDNGTTYLSVDLAGMAPGVYLYRMVNWQGTSATRRLIIQ